MRYTFYAPVYDLVSAEPVYRPGRVTAVEALRLRPGQRVLDVGCGTGLNFPLLRGAVGASGRVVGVDRSARMLDQAGRRAGRRDWGNVDLVRIDAAELEADALGGPGREAGFDAVLFTYALSLMADWETAWERATALAVPGARVAVVDMQRPEGRAAALSPLARLACALGGADIEAHPWTAVEQHTVDTGSWSLRGGHVQVRAGTLATPSTRGGDRP